MWESRFSFSSLGAMTRWGLTSCRQRLYEVSLWQCVRIGVFFWSGTGFAGHIFLGPRLREHFPVY